MADIIDHIDEIARQRKRDVAGIFFQLDLDQPFEPQMKHIEQIRAQIIEWLDARGIAWLPCFDFFDGDIDPFYKGDIYVDLPVDPRNDLFAELTRMLENADETPRIEGVNFRFYRYSQALENEPFYKDSLEDI